MDFFHGGGSLTEEKDNWRGDEGVRQLWRRRVMPFGGGRPADPLLSVMEEPAGWRGGAREERERSSDHTEKREEEVRHARDPAGDQRRRHFCRDAAPVRG